MLRETLTMLLLESVVEEIAIDPTNTSKVKLELSNSIL